MPFPVESERRHLLERARRLGRNPVTAYGVAVAATAVATAVRWLAAPELIAGVPFITYYPAIILATLVGGLWPGLLSLVLASLTAWYFFLPPIGSWGLDHQAVFSLLFFAFIASINIALVRLLDQAMERVVAREDNIRLLVESAPNGVLVVDADGNIRLLNASAEKLFGYGRAELLGRNVEVLVPERHVAAHAVVRDDFQRKPETRAMGAGRDLSGRRKDGSEFPLEIGLNPLVRDGRKAVLATVVDISARRQAQEAQRLLIDELMHRTRNLFAVVQAVANQTLAQGRSLAEARYVFNNRLQALAQAYAMTEIAGGASLSRILDRQFAGFTARVTVSGCDVPVGAAAAQQFAMIVHELTTNALKYGALSEARGQVSIVGRIDGSGDEGLFRFQWKESGGPPVAQATRTGFGTAILVDMAGQFGRNVAVTYAPEGFVYEIDVPLTTMNPTSAMDGVSRPKVRDAEAKGVAVP